MAALTPIAKLAAAIVAGSDLLVDVHDAHIVRVLVDCNGNVSHTAARLGIYRSTLQRKLRKIRETRT